MGTIMMGDCDWRHKHVIGSEAHGERGKSRAR